MTNPFSSSDAVGRQPSSRERDRTPARIVGGKALLVNQASVTLPSIRISIYASLAGLEDAWRQLERTADCYAFQTWDWNAVWYDHVGKRDGVKLRIIRLAAADGALLGLWPLCIYRRHGLRVLGYMGDLVSDYRAPLLAPAWAQALSARRFDALWLECLKKLRGVDVVMLQRMPQRFNRSDNPMVGLQGAQPAENAYSVRLPQSVADYQMGRSKRLLAENRRKVRRLKDRGAFSVEKVCDDGAESRAVFSAIVRQKSRRWRESGSRDLFADPAYLGFYEALTRRGLPTGFVTMSRMKVADTVVAAHWGLVFDHRYYGILSSFENGDWRKYSCGELLVQFQIERAIDTELEVFDLTVGDEGYKKSWATDCLPLYCWRRARSLRGRLYLLCVRARELARSVTVLRRGVRYAKRVGHCLAGSSRAR